MNPYFFSQPKHDCHHPARQQIFQRRMSAKEESSSSVVIHPRIPGPPNTRGTSRHRVFVKTAPSQGTSDRVTLRARPSPYRRFVSPQPISQAHRVYAEYPSRAQCTHLIPRDHPTAQHSRRAAKPKQHPFAHPHLHGRIVQVPVLQRFAGPCIHQATADKPHPGRPARKHGLHPGQSRPVPDSHLPSVATSDPGTSGTSNFRLAAGHQQSVLPKESL